MENIDANWREVQSGRAKELGLISQASNGVYGLLLQGEWLTKTDVLYCS